MHLVQLLLPLRHRGADFPRAMFARVRSELAERFGGVTAYLRAPAQGLWEDEDGECVRDEVVLVEVMVDDLDREWWRAYRGELEQRFDQDEIVLRATGVERI